jgi:hypothetical protein
VQSNASQDAFSFECKNNCANISAVEGYNIFVAWANPNSTSSINPSDYANLTDVTGSVKDVIKRVMDVNPCTGGAFIADNSIPYGSESGFGNRFFRVNASTVGIAIWGTQEDCAAGNVSAANATAAGANVTAANATVANETAAAANATEAAAN